MDCDTDDQVLLANHGDGQQQKREQGVWWTRQYLGTYAPTITLREDGRYGVVAGPSREAEPEP